MGGHRRDAAPRQAPRPSWWLPATTISEQTRSPGPVCVSVRAAAAAARVRENVHSDSIAHGERARHGEREYRGRGDPPGPAGGIAPRGAVSGRPYAAQIADLFGIDYFFNPLHSTVRRLRGVCGQPSPSQARCPLFNSPFTVAGWRGWGWLCP